MKQRLGPPPCRCTVVRLFIDVSLLLRNGPTIRIVPTGPLSSPLSVVDVSLSTLPRSLGTEFPAPSVRHSMTLVRSPHVTLGQASEITWHLGTIASPEEVANVNQPVRVDERRLLMPPRYLSAVVEYAVYRRTFPLTGYSAEPIGPRAAIGHFIWEYRIV